MAAPQAQLPLSAGARVAGIPELLEQILLNLIDAPSSEADQQPKDQIVGLQTALLSQRTSHAFRDTIIGSSAIRRALFGEDAKPAVSGFPKANPMLLDSIVGYDLSESGPFKVKVWPIYDYSSYSVTAVYKGYKVRVHRMYPTRNRISKRKRQGKDFRASWRQMRLLSETGAVPIIQLELKCVSETSILEGRWENPTLGEVFDQLYGTGT
ncbi:uncharacterized protein MYCFIDRAFT_78362 [Pseudocercospora fijiensis CIRAD86]|uniref:Uncharacterized protein n=1 Tax=Pseudocercospora fijiensis (strain CIRAD86) TaxID=383855 RepID=M3ANF7_PSEFD|nr:uncharacterized protein MYCFIDRAFT_78362 [Pseudocercospora fijiensis CIRAD86]EME78653.1 hypothetical protein MYCFIDRAFT_78362 [Pseudocercospora fijiensis CIRAD86]